MAAFTRWCVQEAFPVVLKADSQLIGLPRHSFSSDALSFAITLEAQVLLERAVMLSASKRLHSDVQ